MYHHVCHQINKLCSFCPSFFFEKNFSCIFREILIKISAQHNIARKYPLEPHTAELTTKKDKSLKLAA